MAAAQQPAIPIIDTHIHLFDTARPEGVPWPSKENSVLYKPALPDRYRQILESRFLQGSSIKEAAAELGISVANAKVLQHRALRLAAQVNDGGQP